MEAPVYIDSYRVGVTFAATNGMEKTGVKAALKSPKVAPIAQQAFAALKLAGIKTFQIELITPGKNEPDSEAIDLTNNLLSIARRGCNERFSKITLTAKSTLEIPPKSAIVDEDKLLETLSYLAEVLQQELQGNKKAKTEHQKHVEYKKLSDGELVFSSGVFEAFKSQIEKFTTELLEQYPKLKNTPQMLEFSQYIFREHKERALHEMQIDSLRSALATEKKDPLMDEFVGKWIEKLFTTVNLETAWQKFLEGYVPNLGVENCITIAETLDAVHAALEKNPKLKGSFPYPAFDQISLGNLPSNLWTIDHGNGRCSQFIRMANCTHIEFLDRLTKKKKITIQPEFVRFLQELQKQGKRFLYINQMITKGDYYENFEPLLKEAFQTQVDLTNIIHQLETEYGLTNIDVVTLDRNSEFYHCRNEGASANDPDLENILYFKGACLDNLFYKGSECPCIWPKRMDKEKLIKDIKEIIENVHKKYFPNKEELNDVQRNVFQDLVMKDLVRYFCIESNCDYYTIACQSSIDRGPSLSALHYWDEVIKKGQNKNSVEILRTVVMFFVNAILMSNRLPHDERVVTFYETLKVMEATADAAAVAVAVEAVQSLKQKDGSS